MGEHLSPEDVCGALRYTPLTFNRAQDYFLPK